jgi:hypothetical protein
MVLTEMPNARAASPADRNSFFFILLLYERMSILLNAFLRSLEAYYPLHEKRNPLQWIVARDPPAAREQDSKDTSM